MQLALLRWVPLGKSWIRHCILTRTRLSHISLAPCWSCYLHGDHVTMALDSCHCGSTSVSHESSSSHALQFHPNNRSCQNKAAHAACLLFEPLWAVNQSPFFSRPWHPLQICKIWLKWIRNFLVFAKEIGIKFNVLLLEGTETFSVAPCDDLDNIIEKILLETAWQVRA